MATFRMMVLLQQHWKYQRGRVSPFTPLRIPYEPFSPPLRQRC